MRRSPGSSREPRLTTSTAVLAVASALILLVLSFNARLYFSTTCDQRLQQLADEKDRELQRVMDQLQKSLDQQARMLQKLSSARGQKGRADLLLPEPAVAAAGSAAAAADPGAARPPKLARRDLVPYVDWTPGALTPPRIAVLVIAYNRASYLDRALGSVMSRHPGGGNWPVYVSQDGENDEVARVIAKHGARRLVHPRRQLDMSRAEKFLKKAPGYAYLSVHYGWALRTLFADAARYEGVIILEEDIEVAPDFFDYFNATAPLLYQDDTLLAVSAFNDNGQPRYSSDTSALYRSDFFPGLGWLLTRRLWAEIGAGWPEERGFWDDWMREPPQRKGRASIRPETSRSRTFGQKGTSLSQFYIKFLAPIQFSDQAAPAWAGRNLSFLLKAAYDPPFAARVAAAREVELRRVIDRSFTASGGGDVVVRYSTPKVLLGFCKQLGIMEDLKAGVPRTAYHGVIPLRVGGVMVFLAPSFAVDQDITQRKPP